MQSFVALFPFQAGAKRDTGHGAAGFALLDQKRNFSPNWICRMGAAKLVICPGPPARIWLGKAPPSVDGRYCVDADRALLGGLKLGVLNMLNISARNCSFMDSLIWKFLNI